MMIKKKSGQVFGTGQESADQPSCLFSELPGLYPSPCLLLGSCSHSTAHGPTGLTTSLSLSLFLSLHPELIQGWSLALTWCVQTPKGKLVKKHADTPSHLPKTLYGADNILNDVSYANNKKNL